MALTDKLTAIAHAIRAKTGKTASMTLDQMPGEISGITGGGGGSSADVRYVTFMNGDTVLYKKPVAVGDDCVDVLTKGLIETPTKESTVQYNYTYYGWGAADNGAADSTILKNITEDKTVYAIYTSAVRYYTITWLDDDGETVLKTESLAYGATPNYVPNKLGYAFVGWTTDVVTVTGNATYTSIWKEQNPEEEEGYVLVLPTTTFTAGFANGYYRSSELEVYEAFVPGAQYKVTVNGTAETKTGQQYTCKLRYGGNYSTISRNGVGNPWVQFTEPGASGSLNSVVLSSDNTSVANSGLWFMRFTTVNSVPYVTCCHGKGIEYSVKIQRVL